MRSAMKKRSCECTSSDSEKVKGIESGEKDIIKKSKKPSWSTSEAGYGAITKDEEEVAETLFSLAGMFPHNASDATSGNTRDASPCPERSPRGTANIESVNETVGRQQNDFLESAKFSVASHSIDQTQATDMLVKSESGSKVALLDSELYLAKGLNEPSQSLNSQIEKQTDKEFEAVGNDSKQKRHVVMDLKENEAQALWPGLSSKPFSGTNVPYLQSYAAKAPDWLNAAMCASKQDVMESCSSSRTIPKIVTHRKSWKSCAAHVLISHLIRSLEGSKGQVKKEADVYKLNQMRVQQISKCGVLKDVYNLNGMRNGISSAAGSFHSSTMRSSNETENSIQQQCYYHDISQASQTPRVYGPQNQNSNLSLCSGGNGLKVKDSFNKGGSRLESLSKYPVPYFQTRQQHRGLVPMPMPQSQYASNSYHDQHPVAGPQVRLQQPHYYGSPLSGSHYSSTVSNKQHHQSFWAVQLSSPQGWSNIMRSQYHKWQSGCYGSSAVSSCAQVIVPRSPESLGSKLTSISEQQLLPLASSFPASRTSGLSIHLPSVFEESRGRSHGGGTPSLQMLCDERI